MSRKRDTTTYALFDRKRKVYIGTTNDPEERAAPHKNQGKRFTRMEITSRRMTEEGAKQKETKQLESYRQGHGGRNPRHNKNSNG